MAQRVLKAIPALKAPLALMAQQVLKAIRVQWVRPVPEGHQDWMVPLVLKAPLVSMAEPAPKVIQVRLVRQDHKV